MTLYAFKKTWEITPNNALAAQADVATTNKNAILNMFNVLTGAGSYNLNGDVGAGTFDWYDTNGDAVASPANFAAVRYSCNSTAVSSLGVNNITTPSHIVTASAASPHTWIILDFPVIHVEVMIALDSGASNYNNMTIVASPYGVTGNRFAVGTTTANPATPVGAQVVQSQTAYGGSATVNAAIKIHVWKTSDGEVFEVGMCNGGKFNTLFRVEKPIVSSTAWTFPHYVYFKGAAANTSVCTVALLHTAANLYTYAAGAATQVSLTMPYIAGTNCCAAQTAVNGVSAAWDMYKQAIGKSGAPAQGIHGEMNDVWWCSSTLVAGNISAASSPHPAGRLWCIGDQFRPGVPGLDCLVS